MKHFDLRVRFSEIEYTLKIINDNLSIFREIINQRESSMLELIIIVLILVEIVDLFITKLLTINDRWKGGRVPGMKKELALDIDIQAQPDDVTCGPTCLQALYSYYGDVVALKEVIQEVKQLKFGGTLAVMLGNHALKRGYKARIYTYNLMYLTQHGLSILQKK